MFVFVARARVSRFAIPTLLLVALLVIATGPASVGALEVPPLRGRVNDYAGLMPPEPARALDERLARFEQQTGHQIAVLTIPSLEGEDLEGFSIRVAEKWKIGKKGLDNGAILLIAKNDRKLRIEVGYGLEGILPDAIASRIIREIIVPHFRANDFSGGIESGIEAILKVTQGETIPEPMRRRSPSRDASPLSGIWILLFTLGAAVLVLMTYLSSLRRTSAWTSSGRRRDDYWGSGFGGGGFGGGGGFSGGGGGFGGGGASGSW